MTLEQWREQDRLVKWAAETFTTPHGREFLKMLEDSHVRHNHVPWDMMKDGHMVALKYGSSEGYSIAINNINAAMQQRITPKALEVTYGAKIKPESK